MLSGLAYWPTYQPFCICSARGIRFHASSGATSGCCSSAGASATGASGSAMGFRRECAQSAFLSTRDFEGAGGGGGCDPRANPHRGCLVQHRWQQASDKAIIQLITGIVQIDLLIWIYLSRPSEINLSDKPNRLSVASSDKSQIPYLSPFPNNQSLVQLYEFVNVHQVSVSVQSTEH